MSSRIAVAAGVLAAAGLVLTSSPAWASGSQRQPCDYDTNTCRTLTGQVNADGMVYGDWVLWGPSGPGTITMHWTSTGRPLQSYSVNFDGNRTDGTVPLTWVPAGSSIDVTVTVRDRTHAMVAGWHQD